MKRFTLAGLALLSTLLLAPVPGMAATAHRPKLKVTTLAGKHFDLATHRGHWVIVNFWATWCHPCIHEMPDISRYIASHPKVTAIGLAYEGGKDAAIRAFLHKHPVVYPIAHLDVMHPPKDFAEPRGLPTTYVIAPNGTVAKRFVGPIDAKQLNSVISAG